MRSILNDDRTALKLGSFCFGIPVTLHYTFFLLLLIELLASIRYMYPAFTLYIFLLYGPVLLVTILIHELGHALSTRKLGGEVGEIILWPLGGFALCGPTDSGAKGDLVVAVSGPLTHLLQMAIWIAFYAVFNGGYFSTFSMSYFLTDLSRSCSSFMAVLSQQSFWTNLFIMAFNLFIPAYPLDGGRCLASTLILCGVNVNRAALITSVTAIVLATSLFLWGVVSFIWLHSPNGLFTALIAIFVFTSSWQLWDLYKAGRVKDHPLFGRACYNEREVQPSIQSEGAHSQSTDETPAVESGTMA
uniref:Peptidase M50 domain-containing protein n=1 Tax=Trieres chinensis TaxID=1514140 RepID=A0A7S1ZEE5_TRICV|mmetsp:Transcript_23869/g.48327  ORF Transcript_23869/g.48327 Transcript_23869/m.48327 type:complete len:302 (+) Transcript_23869:102-1007(+)|eukprot:CAMPEP_0183308872 /NCGR_PEP_ID=MMETSP0160_2-20130417/22760_1 /TAXON_ID=2839 ORGANISM="Odontella Sinensis, Strain Grunow 1884" /NCGR_SAMPLE_ID=MMETSP0160_2 /ASSEMBLY_ACC=CAM_ASM_000250 /LENGTH=301 /DNA_ID=CAMNT_0025472781 /DNA_START=59 /DNA_END=964 /DNA_ORIENTATION=+